VHGPMDGRFGLVSFFNSISCVQYINCHCYILFVAYLTTLSVAQTVQPIMNGELVGVW
jgi:hypothetical protein